jgi:hypothetical protein
MQQSSHVELPLERSDAAPAASAAPVRIWGAALGTGTLVTGLVFDALPGLNWLLALLLVIAGLHIAGGPRLWSRLGRHARLAIAVALLLAGGTVITANGVLHFWSLLGIVSLCAIATLLTAGLPVDRLGPARMALAPFQVGLLVVREAGRRCGRDARGLIRDEHGFRVLRGAGLALPIVWVFFLLLGGADPTLAAWRDALAKAFEDLSIAPRTVFFVLVTVVLLGAYGVATSSPRGTLATETVPSELLADLERIIVLGAVAALFALFVVLQVTDLFGDPGARAGSGLTYAEALHRGFIELTAAVSLCATLIIAGDRLAIRGARESLVRALGLLLVAECFVLLGSATQRLLAYPAAYGYTTLRLYVAIYIVAAACALVLLAREVSTTLNLARLAPRVVGVAVLALCVPMYWNSAAWVARQNLERYARSGALDVQYLAYGLSADSIPTVVAALRTLPPDAAATIASRLRASDRRALVPDQAPPRWFEWNYRRAAARAALATSRVAGGDPRGFDGTPHGSAVPAQSGSAGGNVQPR